LHGVVDVLRNFGTNVDIWGSHDLSQGVSQLYLLDLDVEVKVQAVLVADFRVVEHFVLSIIRALSHVVKVELMHGMLLSTQSLEDVNAVLLVHQLEASYKVKLSVLSLFLSEFFGVEVPNIIEA
jgi:hypothetical protein